MQYRVLINIIRAIPSTIDAAARTAVFVLKVLPTLPSRPVDWLTPVPVRERVRYPTQHGLVDAEIARPSGRGPHPGIVVSLGVVPFGVEHPQVPRLQEALARAGFVSLLYWSPHMRGWRLDPVDIENLAMAYEWLTGRPDVDPDRSGLFGTYIGGSFALMAAASPRIRDRVAFVGAFSPYASMRTLSHDIATATWRRNGNVAPWPVDPLTRKVYVHSLTAGLEPDEAARLRETMAEPWGDIDTETLSVEGRAVHRLLTLLRPEEVDAAVDALSPDLRKRLDALSPTSYLASVRAPLILLMHDQDDPVIPRTESLDLREALADRPGFRYTEFVMFKHLTRARCTCRCCHCCANSAAFFWPSVRCFGGPRHHGCRAAEIRCRAGNFPFPANRLMQ